ncbi:hypothetical protein [uncultured Sphingomonas sp.]|uniref:hypothetical protein n=1 Tax=uncultured Sphingomonas sp. TaxID=158754 RepID=UPI0035CAAA85
MAKRVPNAADRRINRWRIAAWGIAALLLLLPLVAMHFTREVDWTGADFLFAGVMIGGVGMLFELAVRKTRDLVYRVGAGLALAAAFLLIWVNAAVGIIGNEDNPLNLLYFGVVAVAIVGAIGARFRPRGMGQAMIAAAAAQTAAGLVAVIAGGDQPPGPIGLALINGFFVALFGGSAWLFGRAARAATGGAMRSIDTGLTSG